MNKQKKTAIIVALLVLGVGTLGWETYERNQINREQAVQTQKLEKAKKALTNATFNVDDKQYNKALNSEDPMVKNNAEATKVTNQFQKVATNFFKIAYTFNSQKSWVARKDKASKYATDDVLNDQKLFNDGKADDGSDYITSTGLSANFQNAYVANGVVNGNDTIDGYVQVTYQASYGDQNAASTTSIYLVKYDVKNQKLTSVQLLGNTQTKAQ